MLFLDTFIKNHLLFLIVWIIIILFCKITVDLNVNRLKFVGCSISTFVLNPQMNLFEFNCLHQMLGTSQLYLDNKEVFTWHAITIWVYATLKHFKLSLRADFNSVF